MSRRQRREVQAAAMSTCCGYCCGFGELAPFLGWCSTCLVRICEAGQPADCFLDSTGTGGGRVWQQLCEHAVATAAATAGMQPSLAGARHICQVWRAGGVHQPCGNRQQQHCQSECQPADCSQEAGRPPCRAAAADPGAAAQHLCAVRGHL